MKKRVFACPYCADLSPGRLLQDQGGLLRNGELIKWGDAPQKRIWVKCDKCGLASYWPRPRKRDLREIYRNYRDIGFRKESCNDYFDRIVNIPASESENKHKIKYISSFIDVPDAVWDVGVEY